MTVSSTPTTASHETGLPASQNNIELSIIVPTYQRPILLERLLASLLKQTVSPERFEVIVVDNSPNGPDPATQALCQEERFNGLHLHPVHQPEPGASAARNLGIAQARARLVGFVDDDEILPMKWAERVLAIQASQHPDVFGGIYRPYYFERKPDWFLDMYMVLDNGPEARWLKPGEYLFGGNMVFQKEWLDQIGGFSLEIGRVGENQEYGEETELQQRAVTNGARLWYDPQLIIYHYTHPDRMRVRWFLQSAWFHGKAKAQLALSKTKTEHRSNLRLRLAGMRDLLPRALRIATLIFRGLFRDRSLYPYIQNYWVEVLTPAISGLSTSINTTRGLLAGSQTAGSSETPRA